MTETDELRRMLDERGVEWAEYGDGYTEFCTRTVVDGEQHYVDVRHYTVQPNVMGSLIVTGLTPEQAIAATLGRGECKMELVNIDGLWMCTKCGYVNAGFALHPGLAVNPKYCPNCGRKVVDEWASE